MASLSCFIFIIFFIRKQCKVLRSSLKNQTTIAYTAVFRHAAQITSVVYGGA